MKHRTFFWCLFVVIFTLSCGAYSSSAKRKQSGKRAASTSANAKSGKRAASTSANAKSGKRAATTSANAKSGKRAASTSANARSGKRAAATSANARSGKRAAATSANARSGKRAAATSMRNARSATTRNARTKNARATASENSSGVVLKCDPGSYDANTSCVVCPAGSACINGTKTLCDYGYYSATGATQCSKCPNDGVTLERGSTTQDSCINITCPSGTTFAIPD